MQDMNPRDRSIRNIPVPAGHHRRSATPPMTEESEEYNEAAPIEPRRKGKKFVWAIAGVVIAVCAVGGVLLSTLFSGASVTVFERHESVDGAVTLTASLNPPTGSLGYAIMSGTRSATTTVPASGTHDVSRTASGVITVYNAYSVDSQRLIARTRFESPDGKIYRIQESINVPGATKNSDGNLTPGSMTVTAYADAPGESYNSNGDTHYTLPALKGDSRYDKMYADGKAMSGGFVGPEPAVADEDLARAKTALQQGLAQAAQSALAAQIPSGYLVLPGTLEVTYSDITQTPATNNTATLSQTATMQAAIVKVDDVAYAVAKQKVAGYDGEAVTFANPTQLIVAAQKSPDNETVLNLNLSGDRTLTWRYDPAALTAALAGKDKGQFETIIKSFAPAIDRAEAKIRPFWKGAFPSQKEEITVVEGEQ